VFLYITTYTDICISKPPRELYYSTIQLEQAPVGPLTWPDLEKHVFVFMFM
jgi:hypothetical protein